MDQLPSDHPGTPLISREPLRRGKLNNSAGTEPESNQNRAGVCLDVFSGRDWADIGHHEQQCAVLLAC